MRLMKARIDDLKLDLEREREARRALDLRVKEVEDRYTNGMERQLGQVRKSSYEVIVDGQTREQRG